MEYEVNNNYEKFPVCLKEKLQSGEEKFPRGVLFEYEKFLAYRAIERKKDDFSGICMNDMRSYYELGKKPRAIVAKNDSAFYAVSLNIEVVKIKELFKFPNPNKKVVRGYVNQEGGPQHTNEEKHVSWWLYENVDLSSFVIVEV